MKRILFLDDDYDRHLKFDKDNKSDEVEIHHIFQAHECMKRLSQYKFDEVHLDHDLGYAHDHYNKLVVQDAKIVIDYIIDNHVSIPYINIHSWNMIGAAWMESRLKESGYNVNVMPFDFQDFYDKGK